MVLLKCKICGGDIELCDNRTHGTCGSCGSNTTLPKVCDGQRAALFNKGNILRIRGEFDRATAVFERIVELDITDAEAHWCLVLCRYGIEYIEDPKSGELVPTCYRASYDSILNDVDYIAAVELSDSYTADMYRAEAKRIAEIQKAVLATSKQAEPYDIFISYKETAAGGGRTKDSVVAQDIYSEFKNMGYRVFFSRITLEGKLGFEYEPYIFAALNSAKVMIIVGTSVEHYNAAWVKNEWIRFLSIMKKERGRLLIPCYQNMNPYDLPDELSMLQAQDMGKIGFLQDLAHGVKKVLGGREKDGGVEESTLAKAAAAAVAQAQAKAEAATKAKVAKLQAEQMIIAEKANIKNFTKELKPLEQRKESLEKQELRRAKERETELRLIKHFEVEKERLNQQKKQLQENFDKNKMSKFDNMIAEFEHMLSKVKTNQLYAKYALAFLGIAVSIAVILNLSILLLIVVGITTIVALFIVGIKMESFVKGGIIDTDYVKEQLSKVNSEKNIEINRYNTEMSSLNKRIEIIDAESKRSSAARNSQSLKKDINELNKEVNAIKNNIAQAEKRIATYEKRLNYVADRENQ